jgi:hypothetical protein
MAVPVILMPSVAFGGLLANVKTISKSIQWVQWLSPTRFAFEALVWAQWPENKFKIADLLGFNLGYEYCVWHSLGIVVVSKILTLICLFVVSKQKLN